MSIRSAAKCWPRVIPGFLGWLYGYGDVKIYLLLALPGEVKFAETGYEGVYGNRAELLA